MHLDLLRAGSYGLYLLFAVLALLVARREPAHRALALFAVWMTTTDWARLLLSSLREGPERPFTGLARISFHFDQALYLSWSFALLALTLHAFTRVRPWYVIVGWAVALAVCLDYPTIRGPAIESIFRVANLTCLGLGLGAVAWALMVRHDLTPKLHHLAVMAFLAADGVTYLLPYMKSVFTEWPVARVVNVVLLTTLSGMHVHALLRPRRLAARSVTR